MCLCPCKSGSQSVSQQASNSVIHQVNHVFIATTHACTHSMCDVIGAVAHVRNYCDGTYHVLIGAAPMITRVSKVLEPVQLRDDYPPALCCHKRFARQRQVEHSDPLPCLRKIPVCLFARSRGCRRHCACRRFNQQHVKVTTRVQVESVI